MKLLLVEDHENVRAMTARLLERMGHEVVQAATGDAGTRAFRESAESFDAIILDLALGDENGAGVAQSLRVIRPDVPLVLTSGSEPDEVVTLAESLSPAVALPKPFRAQELERALDRVSGRG